jgi:hypothetical protein
VVEEKRKAKSPWLCIPYKYKNNSNILPAPADNTGTKAASINPLALFLAGHVEAQCRQLG